MPRGKRLATATMVCLSIVAALVLVATVVAVWDRSAKHIDDMHHPSLMWRSLLVLTQHPFFYPAIVIALAGVAASVALVFLMRSGQRWPYLVAAIGSALAIVAPWLLRRQVWRIEAGMGSAKWASKSPYVHAATTAAIAVTVVLAVLAALSLATYVATRPQRSA